ncbi:MAG: zinc ribbon domain-containing protein [Candidatus Omnitrophica bacterium]|nr:zinc ribbon domain-containing protein [Candidatus Omnitrophota bacterium]
MPTYEYRCDKCKKTFEVFQSIKAKPINKCPACSSPVRKLISAGGGILFKGSGFYTTDYRSKQYKEKQSKEKSGSITCPKTGLPADRHGKSADCSSCKG